MQNKNGIKLINQCIIENTSRIIIKFSKNSELFAYYCMDQHYLKVYDIKDKILDVIPKIDNDETIFTYKKDNSDMFDFKNVSDIHFDV